MSFAYWGICHSRNGLVSVLIETQYSAISIQQSVAIADKLSYDVMFASSIIILSKLYPKLNTMVKRVQVVLSKDVQKLGKDGDLVEVAPGYARNYLIPQGIAVRATSGVLKQVERRREQERQRILEIKRQAESMKTALQTINRFTISKQLGEDNAIFGTVTSQDLADAIQESTGKEIDRRGITLPEISQLGFYNAEIKLHPEVTATVEIHVVPK